MFYVNLDYIDGVLISEVKKHQIWQTLEDFADICNLPYIDSDYDDREEGNNFYIIKASIYLLEDSNSFTHSPFIVGINSQIFV